LRGILFAQIMPLPYPHRATFLASTLVVPLKDAAATPYLARLLSLIVFDHFLRHPVVTLGDEDERFGDEQGRLLDASHPQIEDTIDWLFRIARRQEVLWFEISIDRMRPQPTRLRARLPNGLGDEWTSSADLTLSQQIGQCLGQWLAARRLPLVASLPQFTVEDVRIAGDRLVKAAQMLTLRNDYAAVPAKLLEPLPKLAIPYLRVLAEIAGAAGRTLDPVILSLDPTHPVARRNAYVTALMRGTVDRREILPLVHEAPMYGKPHLSIWGEPFDADRPIEHMGVRHQGIAASLMPGNPYACHNYSLQLAQHGRREESYRWADRATVAAPDFGAAHLDCVRRLRQVGRPGQAFAEAQYRYREIMDRASAGKLPANDWQAPHHAALLVAFAHLDVGRLAEAIELADTALAQLPDNPATKEAFAWAHKRVSHWKTDAGLLARAYAWEGYHRGDPGRAICGLARGRITDDEDAQIMIESLCTIGREDQAEVAYHQCAGLDGTGVLGDGKARLAAARALILNGKLDDALDQIQIAQLRRSQSRLEAEINRLLRLAAIRPAAEWERVIERRLDRGALRLAQMAARDLADFVPGMATPIVERALGERTPIAADPRWVKELLATLPPIQKTAANVLTRLARPDDDSLAAADQLATEWWTALTPSTKDRDAHAAGAVLALGVSLIQYFAEASVAPTPIAGAYRHIATEALHLVRRARYQIEQTAIHALLRVFEHLAQAPEWLLDTWLLRVERALDLEAEHGAYLEGLTGGLPTVQRLLRGDERIGWELRFAHDLAADPTMYEPAAALFERCSRAVEAGGVELAWSLAAAAALPPPAHLDVHWLAALANPTGVMAPWLHLAQALMLSGKRQEGFAAACQAVSAATAQERPQAVATLAGAWRTAGITTPLEGDQAFEAGLVAVSEEQLDTGIQHLRWAVAVEPGNAKRAQSLAATLARAGLGFDAIRVLSAHERHDAPRLIGRMLCEAGRHADALPILRYASRRFRSAEDWALLASAAFRAGDDAVTVEAGRRGVQLGSTDPDVLVALATGLYRLGEFVECEKIAQQLIGNRQLPRDLRAVGLHAMARALAGQGRHVDAHPYAKEAARLAPNGAVAADLVETMDHIVAQQTPPTRTSPELSLERRAWADLEAGRFDALRSAITSPSWGITRAALAACEFRGQDENGIPVAPRALEAAVAVLGRTVGVTHRDGVLARIRALRIRDNAFIQIDPPPPLGLRYTWEEFEREYMERDRRPHRPSALLSYAH
jgi:tetratricopeptide (TPR) repeat protein